MTLTVLASVSLLALVVTARPVIPDSHDHDSDNFDNSARPADVQSAVQAIFESRTKDSSSDIDLSAHPIGGYNIHLISPERQQSYLAALDNDAIKALLPLGQPGDDGEMNEDEKRLRQMLLDAAAAEKGGVDMAQSGQMDDVDGEGWPVTPSETQKSLTASEPESDSSLVSTPESDDELSIKEEPSDVVAQLDESEISPTDLSALFADHTIIILVTSSALALVIVACVGAALYALYCVRGLVRSDAAWQAVKGVGLEKQGRIALPGNDGDEEDDGTHAGVVEKVVLNEKDVEKGRVVILLPAVEMNEKNDIDIDSASSVGDDTDYLDALDTTPTLNHPVLPPSSSSPTASPLPRWSELARKDSRAELRRQGSLSNLNLSLKQTSTPPSSLSRETSKALLRELAAATLQASDPELPAIPPSSIATNSDSSARSNPESTSSPPRYQLDLHAARRNVPQTQNAQARERQVLDFALAMQLGPSGINGTGVLSALARVGADPAWVLNVVIAVFGWVAVIIGGQGTKNAARQSERRTTVIAH